MVNVHILGNKDFFVSKNAIQKIKKFIKDNNDLSLIDSSNYLKEGYIFDVRKEDENVYLTINEEEKNVNIDKEEKRQKLKDRLKQMKNDRYGTNIKKMNQMKKTVDKSLFKKYSLIQKFAQNSPVPKPDEVLDNPSMYKDQIQMFGSGFLKISGNEKYDSLISSYFKELANKLGYPVYGINELQEKIKQQMPQQPKTEPSGEVSNINLESYVDSDTESESSDDDPPDLIETNN